MSVRLVYLHFCTQHLRIQCAANNYHEHKTLLLGVQLSRAHRIPSIEVTRMTEILRWRFKTNANQPTNRGGAITKIMNQRMSNRR